MVIFYPEGDSKAAFALLAGDMLVSNGGEAIYILKKER